MKNISQQYKDLQEGKISRDYFVRNCRQQFPQYISPVTSVDDAIKILKSKRIIAESISENMDYKDPYVRGYVDNENGSSLNDCPYDVQKDINLWINGWMDAESEKQMDHDEETYKRETGGYGDLSALKEGVTYEEGRWKETTGKDQYARFADIDNVNFTTFLRAVAFEAAKQDEMSDDMLPALLEKVAKKMRKDPNAYRELVVANYAEIAKQDEPLKMKEVKPGNMVDKERGMKEVKGQEKPKADSAPKTENKKGKPQGVKEMGITPKKAPGIKSVMDMPGKEKVLDDLKESLKKSLKEDTHYKYNPGTEVDTPHGKGQVSDIIGGTITVRLDNGEERDYQINVLDAIEDKKNKLANMPNLGDIGQKWMSNQIREDEANPEAELELALRTHDWYYRMSDDPRAYDKGEDELFNITKLMKTVPREVATALYNKYSPWKLENESVDKTKNDKYGKLKEFLKKAIKKEAIYQKKDQTGQTQTVIASSPKSDATLKAQKYTKVSGTDDAKSTQ